MVRAPTIVDNIQDAYVIGDNHPGYHPENGSASTQRNNMKLLLPLLLAIHGLIHLIGFFKKSKPVTIAQPDITTHPALIANLSLLGCMLFIATATGYYFDKAWWLITAVIAVILSEVLIILYWNEAKWGTLLNLIIVLSVIVGGGQQSFKAMVNREVNQLHRTVTSTDKSIVSTETIQYLPSVVRKWLRNSGIVGRERIRTVRLYQKGMMRSKPGQETWTSMLAEQHYSVDEPSFVWNATISMMPGITIHARDKYLDGKGEMKIKLLSLVPIANNTGFQIDQGTLQRWLAEICWFPSAALSPYIQWESIDEASAKATMTYKGVSGCAIFHFDREGNLLACSARRYMSNGRKTSLEKWEVKNTEFRAMSGLKIPAKSEVTWKLEGGDFTWLKLEITGIEYNYQN